MLKRVLLGIVLILSIITWIQAGENLVLNPGFEEGSGKIPQSWFTDMWKKRDGVTEFVWKSEGAYSGTKCFYINNIETNDARVMQKITVEPNKMYKLSCFTKQINKSEEGTGANISVRGKVETSLPIKKNPEEWQNISLYIKTTENITDITVTIGLGGYGSIASGEAWFDDVVVEEVDTIPPGAKTAIIEEKAEEEEKKVEPEEVQKEKIKSQEKPATNWVLIIVIISLGVVVVVLLIIIAIKKDTSSEKPENEDEAGPEVSEKSDDEKPEKEEETPPLEPETEDKDS